MLNTILHFQRFILSVFCPLYLNIGRVHIREVISPIPQDSN